MNIREQQYCVVRDLYTQWFARKHGGRIDMNEIKAYARWEVTDLTNTFPRDAELREISNNNTNKIRRVRSIYEIRDLMLGYWSQIYRYIQVSANKSLETISECYPQLSRHPKTYLYVISQLEVGRKLPQLMVDIFDTKQNSTSTNEITEQEIRAVIRSNGKNPYRMPESNLTERDLAILYEVAFLQNHFATGANLHTICIFAAVSMMEKVKAIARLLPWIEFERQRAAAYEAQIKTAENRNCLETAVAYATGWLYDILVTEADVLNNVLEKAGYEQEELLRCERIETKINELKRMADVIISASEEDPALARILSHVGMNSFHKFTIPINADSRQVMTRAEDEEITETFYR